MWESRGIVWTLEQIPGGFGGILKRVLHWTTGVPVRHFHHGHACVVVVDELPLRFKHDFCGQHRWSCRQIDGFLTCFWQDEVDRLLWELAAVQTFKCEHNAVNALVAVTLLLQSSKEFVRQCKAWKSNAHVFAFIQSQTQVLDEVGHEEARFKVSVHDSRCVVVYREGAHATAGDGRQPFCQVEAGTVSKD